MRQSCKSRIMQRREQHSDGDSDRFLRIISRFGFAVFDDRIDAKNNDQIRRDFEKRFMFIRSKRRESTQPFFRHSPVIAFVFFFFCGFADFSFYFADPAQRQNATAANALPKALFRRSKSLFRSIQTEHLYRKNRARCAADSYFHKILRRVFFVRLHFRYIEIQAERDSVLENLCSFLTGARASRSPRSGRSKPNA